MSNDKPVAEKRPRAAGLYTIIVLKLGKGLLLLAVALGIYSLVGDDLGEQLERFLRFVNLNPEREFFVALGRRLESISPTNLRWTASGTLLYSVLLFCEGIGLAFRTYWAAWLAIGETAFFIPIEVFDLLRRPSFLVAVILVINILIVVYLARNRNRLFHHHHHHHHPGG